MDYMFSIGEVCRFAMQTGTTSIITETSELGFKLGYRGIMEFLKSTRDQPVKFWLTFPPVVATSPITAEHTLSEDEVRRLLRKKRGAGIGRAVLGAGFKRG
jgi:adenine deaminase